MPRGLLILLNTLVALALAEGAARVAEWAHPAGDGITFAYAPYRMLKMTRAPWPLDRDGFRAHELNTYSGASGQSFLIEFVGGSVCLGVGENPGAPLPDLLEDELRRAGLARARVLNLCQGGATSAEELAILVQYGLPLHPEAVLSFDGANDILHPRPVGEDGAPNLPYLNAQMEARVDGRDGLSHLALARVAARVAGHFRMPAPVVGEPVPLEGIVDSYAYYLSSARTLAESDHAYYAVLLQPALALDKPWSAEERSMWQRRRPRDAQRLREVIHDRYAQARAGVLEWGSATGTRVYDLTRVFTGVEDTIYSDSVHFRGGRGYPLLLDALDREGLLEQLRQRYRAWETAL